MNRHLNLFFPQWQGSGRRSVYEGALAFKARVHGEWDLLEIPVATVDQAGITKNIRDYEVLLLQLQAAMQAIDNREPQSILTIGGDCSSTLAPIAYLNRLYSGKMAVVWLDAHGDLNSPASSVSKLFTGMPLRCLLGEGEPEIITILDSRLETGQLMLAGTRDLDPQEAEYIAASSIAVVGPELLEASPYCVMERLKELGFTQVYIHIDTDVLDPVSFPFSAWNAPGGIRLETLEKVISGLTRNFTVVGMSVVEFVPFDDSGADQMKRIFDACQDWHGCLE
jgi:arginase